MLVSLAGSRREALELYASEAKNCYWRKLLIDVCPQQ